MNNNADTQRTHVQYKHNGNTQNTNMQDSICVTCIADMADTYMRTCFGTLHNKVKSVVILALLLRCCIDAALLLHCLANIAPQAEERRGATEVGGSSDLVQQANVRQVDLHGERRTAS